MGRHDADPAERRRVTGLVLAGVVLLALLALALYALRALSHG